MATRQRIVPIRREYNQWVANQTLEDYALRFTAKSARRWSAGRVANTALGAVSFLALEAIGGTITVGYGFDNAVAAILVVGAIIFAAGLPIAYYAARYGVDIDLLTRGAGFGYIGSTITSLIYASFTFIFFAIEAAILAGMLEMTFGIPPPVGYVICALGVIPLATHGITFISRFQLWTQPVWIVLHLLPFAAIALRGHGTWAAWTGFEGLARPPGSHGFDMLMFGAAASVVFSLIAQIGEQVDFLRFLPQPTDAASRRRWWFALIAGGPGWIVLGTLKLLAGSFLASLVIRDGLPAALAVQPTQMYRIAFGYVLGGGVASLVLASCFVVISQMKINVTNAYAGSIAWSNFFSRLTHSHPGRVVWLTFNIAIALLLMELGIYQAIEHILGAYSTVAAAWMGALVADLVVNKTFGLSQPHIEFKRAHLFDINPVGVGAMLCGLAVALVGYRGWIGTLAQAVSPFLAFATAFVAAPLIAIATAGKFYLARKPRAHWAGRSSLRCSVCENAFEPEDTAFCPAYSGPICSLCCSLDARCQDSCKPAMRWPSGIGSPINALLPQPLQIAVNTSLARFFGVFALLATVIGAIMLAIHAGASASLPGDRAVMAAAFWQAYAVLLVIAGVTAWLLVLAQDSRRVAQTETRRQTALLMSESRAHKRTDAQLQKAKDVAEAANLAKSRFVVGVSHELRSPLNAMLGYAQLLETDETVPARAREAIGIIRRSGEHLAALIEGLLDISKIEAGRIELYRDRVRLTEFLEQLVNMFRLQAEAKGVGFVFTRPEILPAVVYTDERRLRQILINLLSNAVKFTEHGQVSFRVRWRTAVTEFEIEDTGIGIPESHLTRIFEPFERVTEPGAALTPGIGLGLTITKLLAQIMGGDIAVASTPGKGSRFIVRLLLSEAMATAKPLPAAARIAGYEGQGRMVVVADDDPVHRTLIQDMLMPLGFTVLEVADGPACIALAEGRRPDLFLIDISMPGMDGWELARRLRASGHADAAIIIVSANAGELRGPVLEKPYVSGVLSKPIDVASLLDMIGCRLSLTWTGTVRGDPLPARQETPPVPSLSLSHLEELRQLASIGYVRGIRDRLDELERESPDAAPYVAHLRAFVAEFRLDALMNAIEAAESEAEP